MLQLLLRNFPGVHGSDEEVLPYFVVESKDSNLVTRYPWRVGEKIYLRHLVDFGFRVIVIVRDGRDVMVSQRLPGSDDYYIKQSYQWARAVEEYLPAINEMPESVRMAKYEALVTHPEKELLALGDFLGFNSPKDPTHLTTPGDWTTASYVIGDRAYIQSNLIGRWKDPKHKARIRWLLADSVVRESMCRLLVQLGYEKDDSWAEEYSAL